MPRHKAICRSHPRPIEYFGADDIDDEVEGEESVEEDNRSDGRADDVVDQKKTAQPSDQSNENDDTLESLKRKRKRKRPNKTNDASEGESSSTPFAKEETADSSTDVASSHYANDKTIYIEGLPYEATEDDVSKFFESCGRISSIRLPKW